MVLTKACYELHDNKDSIDDEDDETPITWTNFKTKFK